MGRRQRPDSYPKLEDYTPTKFMLPTSHYDEAKADRAVHFIEMLPHTKGEWEGQPFWLLPWQERIIRDIFGVVKEDGMRQFKTVYIETAKKSGKSELVAAIALYLLYADYEPSAEVFSAAADRQQASIVFEVARRMIELTPALSKRSKILAAGKRVVNYSNAGYYQVVSAEVGGKHGFSISGLVFDELHTQPNRQLWDLEHATFSNIEHQSIDFVVHTLTPWLVRFEQAIVKDLLLPDEQDEYFPKFNVDGLLRGDYKSRMEGYAVGINNGFMSPNDCRRLEQFDCIPPEKGGDNYMVNGNMVKLENVGAAYVKSGNDNGDTDRDVGNAVRKPNGNRKS